MATVRIYAGEYNENDLVEWVVAELDYATFKQPKRVHFRLRDYRVEAVLLKIPVRHDSMPYLHAWFCQSYRANSHLKTRAYGSIDFELMIAQDIFCVLERHGLRVELVGEALK